MSRRERGEGVLTAAVAHEPRDVSGGIRAATFSVGAIVGPWVGPAGSRGWHTLVAAAVVALIAVVQVVWLYRARSTRRWRAALEVYAEREIARDRRGKAPPL
jgi:hypothetical protein